MALKYTQPARKQTESNARKPCWSRKTRHYGKLGEEKRTNLNEMEQQRQRENKRNMLGVKI